jgi:hypothetical protein
MLRLLTHSKDDSNLINKIDVYLNQVKTHYAKILYTDKSLPHYSEKFQKLAENLKKVLSEDHQEHKILIFCDIKAVAKYMSLALNMIGKFL